MSNQDQTPSAVVLHRHRPDVTHSTEHAAAMERVRDIMAEVEVRFTEVLDDTLGLPAVEPAQPSSQDDAFDAAGAAFAAALRELLDGQPPEHELNVAEAARAAAAAELWSRSVGELVSPEHFARLLGVSRQRVQRMCTDHKLAAARDRRGHWQIPAWQSALSAAGRERLAQAAETFEDSGASPWSALSWLVQPHPELDESAPRDLADDELASELLLATARRDASS